LIVGDPVRKYVMDAGAGGAVVVVVAGSVVVVDVVLVVVVVPLGTVVVVVGPLLGMTVMVTDSVAVLPAPFDTVSL
jgi:hypothetical protein